MKEIQLEYDHWGGHKNSVLPILKRAITQYLRKYKKIRIGVTGRSPELRLKEHLKVYPNMKRMIIKYETTSFKYICDIEKELVDFSWNSNINVVSGGVLTPTEGKYYLYVQLF